MLLRLFLNDNLLDTAAMSHLAKGAWPCLEMLWVHDNRIPAEGINLLTTASWPQLEDLSIDAAVMYEDTHNVFSLMPTSGPQYTRGRIRVYEVKADSLIWPELVRLIVMSQVEPCTAPPKGFLMCQEVRNPGL